MLLRVAINFEEFPVQRFAGTRGGGAGLGLGVGGDEARAPGV